MKTAEEKAGNIVETWFKTNGSKNTIRLQLIRAMKDQDRDTRHACAESISGLDHDYIEDADHALEVAHSKIMNTKAV